VSFGGRGKTEARRKEGSDRDWHGLNQKRSRWHVIPVPAGVTNGLALTDRHIADIKTSIARQRKSSTSVRGSPRIELAGMILVLPPDTLAGFEQRPADHSGAAQGVAVVRRASFSCAEGCETGEPASS
jgi:hypothetical protein